MSKCIHNKNYYYCINCPGAGICEHNKQRHRCKDCKGKSICQHNIEKYRCRDCKGSSICKHNKRRHNCRDCEGTSICVHNKRRIQCKDCKGSSICQHNKRKDFCKSCSPNSKYICKSDWCETLIKNHKYEGYCLSCFVNNPENANKPAMRNYKTKEKEVVDKIINKFSVYEWIHDKQIQDGCSKRRPDLLLDLGSHIIIVEIDENKHENIECNCENKRMMELSKDLNHRTIVFIRFNPDEYTDINGNIIKSCWKLNKNGIMTLNLKKIKEWNERLEALFFQINYWINNISDKTIELIQIFY